MSEDKKFDIAPLELVKHCVNCGKMAMMQNPVKVNDGIVECSACGVSFQVRIPKN